MGKKTCLAGLLILLIIGLGALTLKAALTGKTGTGAYGVLIVNTNLGAEELGGYDLMQKQVAAILPQAVISIRHYELVDSTLIKDLKPRAVILGGQGTPWKEYPKEKLEPIFKVIRESNVPLLGVCGGHQLIALAFGAEVSPIEVLDASKPGYEGCWREKGFTTVKNVGPEDALFKGLPGNVTAYENHCDEVKNLPDNFVLLAVGDKSVIQAFRHKTRAIYGVQFHPEAFDQDHRDGELILRNFLLDIAK
ncbi:MAG: gamma-glutamyl-gamma-aminobutyrate hydrolase family protein [Clostridia bacterium]|nr:gamma-glutamyl-gamma-aminobutyrate hydrolase family protein [Clostridia bacterium]